MNDIIITPLGTISPYTKGDMNCPGFLLENNDIKLLLDCGNGITRLLHFPEDLYNLHVIISHYHKDHLGDLGAIQYASRVYNKLKYLDKKVKVYLPKTDYAATKEAILLNSDSYCEYIDINDNDTFNIGNLKITIKDNHSHSIESFMIKIENDDYKIVYTSDIGNTNFDELIDFCKNSDLLICESSFVEEHHANSKTHLTAHEGAMLAKLSNSKKLVLTHFWPEESKDNYLHEAKQVFDDTIVAEEGKKLILKK